MSQGANAEVFNFRHADGGDTAEIDSPRCFELHRRGPRGYWLLSCAFRHWIIV